MSFQCEHKRTQVIARQEGVDYVRCMDCGQVFEEDDLETVPLDEDEDRDYR